MSTALPAHAIAMLDRASIDLQVDGANVPVHIHEVSLPYHWDRLHDGASGRAHFSIPVSITDLQPPRAIYIPRIGNTFEVRFNDRLIGRKGTAGNLHEDFSTQPHFFVIPDGVLRDKNTLDITIDVQGGRNGGLTPVFFGEEGEIRAEYDSRYRQQVTASLVVVVISLALGGMAMLVWFRQRDFLYLVYASAEFLWSIYISAPLIEYTPLPWPWWGFVRFTAYAISGMSVVKFVLVAMELNKGWLRQASNWFLIFSPLIVAIGVFGKTPWMEQMWVTTGGVVAICVFAKSFWYGIRSKESEKRAMLVGIFFFVLGGLRDETLNVILPYTKIMPAYTNYFGSTSWTLYTWPVFGVMLAWIIAERMRRSTRELAHMNQTLSNRLMEREAELHQAFALQSDVQRHQAMIEERQRLTRDMHDGLGSQLVGALQLAQSPGVSRETLTEQLRETLDHLRLTVDAMQDTQGDIASLLGALRYRISPRLEAAGVELAWSVEALPAIPGWSLQHSRNLQMILFEAFSNLITHAHATRATLHATHDDEKCHIRIVLRDNGRGFDAGPVTLDTGHGMRNMRTRAAKIDADLHIDSTPDGTEITLLLTLLLSHGSSRQ